MNYDNYHMTRPSCHITHSDKGLGVVEGGGGRGKRALNFMDSFVSTTSKEIFLADGMNFGSIYVIYSYLLKRSGISLAT